MDTFSPFSEDIVHMVVLTTTQFKVWQTLEPPEWSQTFTCSLAEARVLQLKLIKCLPQLARTFGVWSGLMSKPIQVQDAHGVDTMPIATANSSLTFSTELERKVKPQESMLRDTCGSQSLEASQLVHLLLLHNYGTLITMDHHHSLIMPLSEDGINLTSNNIKVIQPYVEPESIKISILDSL